MGLIQEARRKIFKLKIYQPCIRKERKSDHFGHNYKRRCHNLMGQQLHRLEPPQGDSRTTTVGSDILKQINCFVATENVKKSGQFNNRRRSSSSIELPLFILTLNYEIGTKVYKIKYLRIFKSAYIILV